MDFSRQNEAKEIIKGAFDCWGDEKLKEYYDTILDVSNTKFCSWFAKEIIKCYGQNYADSVWTNIALYKDLALLDFIIFLAGVEIQDEHERRLKERINTPPLQ